MAYDKADISFHDTGGYRDFVSRITEALFAGGLTVGGMRLVTAMLLSSAYYAKPREREISHRDAFRSGYSKRAVLPGLSRSGSTIATEYIG